MARALQSSPRMKKTILVASTLAFASLSAAAFADSACYIPPQCPVVYADAGCPEGSAGTCGPDAGGKCGHVPSHCEPVGETVCVGPTPPDPPADWCADKSGCSIASRSSGFGQHAALPAFFVAAGAIALFFDRRNRKRISR